MRSGKHASEGKGGSIGERRGRRRDTGRGGRKGGKRGRRWGTGGFDTGTHLFHSHAPASFSVCQPRSPTNALRAHTHAMHARTHARTRTQARTLTWQSAQIKSADSAAHNPSSPHPRTAHPSTVVTDLSTILPSSLHREHRPPPPNPPALSPPSTSKAGRHSNSGPGRQRECRHVGGGHAACRSTGLSESRQSS